MRFGKDDENTHQRMQLRRMLSKYIPGAKKRHLGENRLRHRGDDNRPE